MARPHTSDQAAADLLRHFMITATREVSFLLPNQQEKEEETLQYSSEETEDPSYVRRRTVSLCSIDMAPTASYGGDKALEEIPAPFVDAPLQSPLSSYSFNNNHTHPTSCILEHHDWRSHGGVALLPKIGPIVPSSTKPKIKMDAKRKRACVGESTQAATIRGTLRKGFNWRQYPEVRKLHPYTSFFGSILFLMSLVHSHETIQLEEYLRLHREGYFQHSSLNYSVEQRNYNNTLTRGLLEVARVEGYVFENFTFTLVRDRLRCYYKSYVQSTKKRKTAAIAN
jgi:hypothetical protein